jgi:hypothetical protein
MVFAIVPTRLFMDVRFRAHTYTLNSMTRVIRNNDVEPRAEKPSTVRNLTANWKAAHLWEGGECCIGRCHLSSGSRT